MGGAFYAAIKAQVDIVPIVLVGTFEMLRMNTYHMMPHPIRLIVADPISDQGSYHQGHRINLRQGAR